VERRLRAGVMDVDNGDEKDDWDDNRLRRSMSAG